MGQYKNKKDLLESNENEHTTYPNIGNTGKAVLRGKLIALSAYIKYKIERALLLLN